MLILTPQLLEKLRTEQPYPELRMEPDRPWADEKHTKFFDRLKAQLPTKD